MSLCISLLCLTTMNLPISGSVLFYCFMQIAVLWICHVCMIFWNVRFPDYYLLLTRRHQLKYIHLMTILIAIFVPCIPVAVAFGTGGFINARFPPLLCLSRSANAAFFSLVLPVSILIASGVSLLLAVFWTLHKVCESNPLYVHCALLLDATIVIVTNSPHFMAHICI